MSNNLYIYRIKYWNLVSVGALCLILLGGYAYEYIGHFIPCPLCILQRLGMIGVALGLALNIHFSIHPRHYAISLFSSIFGIAVALRHVALNACACGWGGVSFGSYPLYVWSFFTFLCSMIGIAIFLFLYKDRESQNRIIEQKQRVFSILSMTSLFLVILIGALGAFQKSGFRF